MTETAPFAGWLPELHRRLSTSTAGPAARTRLLLEDGLAREREVRAAPLPLPESST